MVSFESSENNGVYDLARLIKILRSPEGCPWDREQTHESIRRNFLEEAYEAVEAIDERDASHLREELGDVLVQVIFHAGIEEDEGRFDLNDVADAAVRKLLFRHPHVFGDVTVSGTQDVLTNWDELKKQEKGQETAADTLLAVAKSLPAMWRAEKIQKKAAKASLIREDLSGAMDKLREELHELESAIESGSENEKYAELGDLLFSAVNIARHLGADPEEALGAATDKFVSRHAALEALATTDGKNVAQLTESELNAYYDKAKAML